MVGWSVQEDGTRSTRSVASGYKLVKWMADMMAPKLGFGGGGTTNI